MDCDKAIYRVYGYLDGELTDDRRHLISTHLDGCSTCLGAFDFEVELRQVISSKCHDDVPPELKRRIAEALGAPLPPEESGPGVGSA